MDANVLQQHKENIVPMSFGRSASKLGTALGEPRKSLAAQRQTLEANLLSDELDDPLQEYVAYIEWIHNHYPQGANSESGLLSVLERCTSTFRDASHYKNDARYLRVWLEYAAYSDAPRDIFVYLAKKKIGVELALYYEEFARFLEVRQAFKDAGEVYDVGISRNARPLARLQRSKTAFVQRMDKRSAQPDQERKRDALTDTSKTPQAFRPASKRQRHAGDGGETGAFPKHQRVAVYEEGVPVSITEEVFKSDDNAVFTSLGVQNENKIAARPWNGEVLKQKVPQKTTAKFTVFRDTPNESAFEWIHDHTLVSNPGKAQERLAVNLNLLYGAEEEMCMGELLGWHSVRSGKRSEKGGSEDTKVDKRGGNEDTKVDKRGGSDTHKADKGENQKKSHHDNGENTEHHHASENGENKEVCGATSGLTSATNTDKLDHTFTIPLRDANFSSQPKSPTMTLFSRLTTNEVLGMFNDAAHNFQSDEESAKAEEPTNYDGFVTETLHGHGHVTTPPTDNYESGSSPFMP